MYKKSALLISGGGSWGAYGGGTLAKINGDYDTVIGVSTGALLAPLAALKEWELLRLGYTSINNDNIFDRNILKPVPFNSSGRVRKSSILMSLLLGHRTIGTSKALRKTIDLFFPEALYDELKINNKEILVGTQNIVETPSKIHYFSSRIEGYEDFKDWMWCSANFPLFTSLVEKGWQDNAGNFHVGLWCDGGLTDLIGFDNLFGKGYTDIDIILHREKKYEKFEGKKINSLLDNIVTSVNVMRHDIEFESFYKIVDKLNRNGANVRIFWLPRKLEVHSMAFNNDLMTDWWYEGYETAFDDNRVEIYEKKG